MSINSDSSPDHPVIRLERDGQVLFAPALPAEVLRQFFTIRHVAAISGTGLETDRQVCPMFSVHREKREIRFPAGLEPALLAACRAVGLTVRLHRTLQELPNVAEPDGDDRQVRTTRTGAPLPPPAVTGPRDSGVLDLVRRYDRGLVRYDPAVVDVAAVIAAVAAAWPDLSLAVVCARVADTRALRDRLRILGLADAIASSSRNRPCVGDAGRVVVATPTGLAGDGVDLAWRRIVIVADALDAVGKRARYCLDHALRARMYALLPLDARPSPHEWDLIRMTFGFAGVSALGPGVVERPVTVEWQTIRDGRQLGPAADLLAVKRKLVWRNGQRNRLAAGLARQIAGGGAGTLVLVEGVEHGLAVAERLPGWPVVSGVPVVEDGLTAARVAVVGTGASPFLLPQVPAVVTPGGLARYDLARVDVIVRADAGTGLPPLPTDQLGSAFPAAPLRLVDLDDKSHPVLRQTARQRRAPYARRGWFAPGIDPVEGRAGQFLAERSELRPRRGNR